MAESMQGLHRTCRCAEVTTQMVGSEVTLMGWVQKARDKGGIIFVDLRDRSGIMQLIFENGSIDEEGFAKAGKLRSEFVIAVTGTVEKRGGAVNENLATGEIEVRAKSLRVLSEAEVPPFPVEENSKTKEDVRLKYRYLDLRRPAPSEKPDLEKPRNAAYQILLYKRGIPGNRDSYAWQEYSRGSKRLPGTVPCTSRLLLWSSAVTAAVQTASDVLRI